MKLLPLLTVVLAPLCAMGSIVLQQNNQLEGDIPVKTTEGWHWEDCGDPKDPVGIKSIEISPDPPKPGQNLTVTVKANVKETIEDGATADVLVKIGVIKLLEKTFDLCKEAVNANASVKCPVEPGDYVIEQVAALPKEIPRAKFVVEVNGHTVEEEPLACVTIEVDFRPKFPHIW